jgi:hypothetical protein
MTAQPTTRIATPFAPQGPPAPQGPTQPAWGAQPVAPQAYGPAYPHSPVAGYPGAYPVPAAPTPERRTGKIVGLVVAALVVLGTLGAGALFLFGPRTVDPVSVRNEIVRITQTAVGVAPTDVHCPDGIKAEAGGTFACTALVDQQPVTYDIRQDDAEGHLTITYNRLIKMVDLQSTIATQVGKDVGVTANVSCAPTGRTVVVNAPGTPIACTATNATDPTDNAKINVEVAADGTPSYTFA